MKLLVISHTPHYLRENTCVGWGPTVREIDHLARIFEQVVHLAPLHPEAAPASSLPYTSERVRLRPVRSAGGNTVREKLHFFCMAGQYFHAIRQELQGADVVQVRCPAAISLMAIIMLSLIRAPKCRWVKYAGNWRPTDNEPWTYALQRWWLQKGLHRGVVTINGHWPEQPAHVFSFYNPSLSRAEVEQSQLSLGKELSVPYQLLFVGAMETDKGVGRILQMAELLKARGIEFVLHLVGGGAGQPYWEDWSREHGLSSFVFFHGWLPRPALADFYARAHFLVFPSVSEGWPKVLSEAMAYGVVPVAGAVSCIPQILAETGAGVAVPPLDIGSLLQALEAFLSQPERWKASSLASMAAAPLFTYEHYLKAVAGMFRQAWGISLFQEQSPNSHQDGQ